VIATWRMRQGRSWSANDKCGHLALSRWPRGAQARSVPCWFVSGLVKETPAGGIDRSRYLVHCARRRATSGRVSCSRHHVFFMTELLGVNNSHTVRYRPLAPVGEFRTSSARGKSAFRLRHSCGSPSRVRPRNFFGLLYSRRPVGSTRQSRGSGEPVDSRTDGHAKRVRPDGDKPPFTTALTTSRRSANTAPHLCWPPSQQPC